MLVELSVVEQRYQAVLQVLAGASVTEVAGRFGVSRQAVHRWLSRYREQGLAGLSDRSSRPRSSPTRTPPEVEALICELRRNHPSWGARRLVWELTPRGCPGPVPCRATVHRVLVRHGLVQVTSGKRRREDYKRWQRSEPMQLWQMDIVGGIMLADGTECKVVTGVDDHSRYCVAATVVARPTGRAVCLALADALGRFGAPDELLTDNGKQFTARFGRGGEVLFDRICRENAITHRLTRPNSPTTTGKVERFHQTLRRELLDDHKPFADLTEAQQAIDGFVDQYNHDRPHQALDMDRHADRFRPRHDAQLPLRLPPALHPVQELPDPDPEPEPVPEPERVPEPEPEPAAVDTAGLVMSANGVDPVDLAVEFTRVVPASGNLAVCGQQFWLGTHRAGVTLTLRADTTVVELLAAGTRIKRVPSRLAPQHLRRLLADGGTRIPPATTKARPGTGEAFEVDRTVNACGLVALGGRQHSVGYQFAGQRVTVRIDGNLLHLLDGSVLLRTLPNPLTAEDLTHVRDARPAGPQPQPQAEPVRVQRRVSSRGQIMIAGQKIQVGIGHAGTTVTIEDTDGTFRITHTGQVIAEVARTTTKPIARFKARKPEERRQLRSSGGSAPSPPAIKVTATR
ncbi:transposase InsO family protein [Actinomadura coerulea]|uniref:Transposase InsO family protein n=1 Tax=Actinomadura coerulea TaxID=46159 RepID=A0A7X0G4B9_9ACTN|nr:transposase InsO family protein [Actinomadura coerulea]